MSATNTPEVTPPADSTPAAPGGSLLDDVAAELVSTMPDVQEHAVQQAEVQQAQQVAAIADNANKDKNGATFDPSIHQATDAGQPVMTTKGTFALRRGRKVGASSGSTMAPKPAAAIGQGKPAPDAQAAAAQQAARNAGAQAAELLFAAGVVIGGDEWQPRKDDKAGIDERAMMQSAMGAYFEAQGKTDISPGMVLAFVVLAYAAPRFAMPKTQSRFQTAKAKVVQWWMNRKLRKQGLTVNVAPVAAPSSVPQGMQAF